MKFKDLDISGGAQFSGRMTALIVAAGAIAEQYLISKGIKIAAYTRSIYNVTDDKEHTFEEISPSKMFRTRSVNADFDSKMSECI